MCEIIKEIAPAFFPQSVDRQGYGITCRGGCQYLTTNADNCREYTANSLSIASQESRFPFPTESVPKTAAFLGLKIYFNIKYASKQHL